MIREMKIQSPKCLKSPKSPTSYNKSKTFDSLNYNSGKTKSEKLCSSPLEKFDFSPESTFFRTKRATDRGEREDAILENLKYFVSNSPTIRKIEESDNTPGTSRVVFTSRDYLGKRNDLIDSIYHEGSFKSMQRKQKKKSTYFSNFFNFDKSKFLGDNVKQLEHVVTELKTEVFDRMSREIADKTKLRDEIENNTNILSNRLKMSQHSLDNYKQSNTGTMHDTTKLEFYSERVLRENSHMDMEIPMLKSRIETMKNEMFENDRETKQLKYQIYRLESEVLFLQEETRRLGKNVIDLQDEKKNMMTAIVLMKKQNDNFKERVIKEDGKSKEFIAEVSTLLHRGKVFY